MDGNISATFNSTGDNSTTPYFNSTGDNSTVPSHNETKIMDDSQWVGNPVNKCFLMLLAVFVVCLCLSIQMCCLRQRLNKS